MNARLWLFLGFLLIAFTVGCAPNEKEFYRSQIKSLRTERDISIRETQEARAERDTAISKRDEAVVALNRADALLKEREAYIQNLVQQMKSSEVDAETSGGIVDMSVELAGLPWDAFGTVVDLGEFGNKIVMMRHTLYRGVKDDRTTLDGMHISIIEPRSRSQHALSLETLTEFPELDFVVFDVPTSLRATPLFLGEVDFSKVSVVSHIYLGEFAFYSQLVQISSLPPDTALPWKLGNVFDDFMRMSGRLNYGDSGGPLVMKEDGKRKVVGFVMAKFNDKEGGGIAVKASSLLRKLTELESQRPHE